MKDRPCPRIAVIGAGRMALDFHLPSQAALAEQGRCTLAAICDVDGEKGARAAKAFGIPAVYRDMERMLNTIRPDGVIVIVPVQFTERVAGYVLRRGFPVMLEKPPGNSPRECRTIADAARSGRAANMVAFNRRFCPVIVQGRAEILKRGATKGASGLMYRHQRGEEDFFFSTGMHSLDALRFLAGDIDRVETVCGPAKRGERPVSQLLIEFVNGGAGTLAVRPQAGVNLERYELFGNEAVASIHAGVEWLLDAPGSCTLYEKNKRVKLSDPLREWKKIRNKKLKAAIAGGFYGENEAFVDALTGKRPFAPGVLETIETVEIAEAVRAGKHWRRTRS